MNTQRATMVMCLSFVALFGVVGLQAEEAKEVPMPTPPKGAGAIDADAPKTMTTTASGLKYRILRKGTGKKPVATDSVNVNYHGWLDGGKVFDSSYDRGQPISFPLNGV